jgi:hypothetical protein
LARKKAPTLLSVAVRNVGFRRGCRAVAFLVCWAIVEDALGRTPTLDEYADWWKESRSTAFREQAIFREAFPGELTPHRIVVLLSGQRRHWHRAGVGGAGEMWAPGTAGIA